MEGDVKEVIGVPIPVIDGGEVFRDEFEELEFEATGELLAALGETSIRLLEFAFDRDARPANDQLDRAMPADLRGSFNTIVHASDN
jgi:hypothetical protein